MPGFNYFVTVIVSKQQADIEVEAVKEWKRRFCMTVSESIEHSVEGEFVLLYWLRLCNTDSFSLFLSSSLILLDHHGFSCLCVACLLPHLFTLFILCCTDDVSEVCFTRASQCNQKCALSMPRVSQAVVLAIALIQITVMETKYMQSVNSIPGSVWICFVICQFVFE